MYNQTNEVQQMEHLKISVEISQNLSIDMKFSQTMTIAEVEALLMQVKTIARATSVPSMPFKKPIGTGYGTREAWKQEDIEFLKDNHGKMRVTEIAKHLGRSEGGIYKKLSILKLTTERANSFVRAEWTEQQEQYIIKNYRTLSIREMAEFLEMKSHVVYHKLGILKAKGRIQE